MSRNLGSLALVLLAACGGSTTTPDAPAVIDGPPGVIDAPHLIDAGSGSNPGSGGSGAFGATCTTDSNTSTECASGVCTDSFGQLGTVCSQQCTMLNATDPSCPNGSMGQKCSMKGYCRP
jgi:hypothetical protein